MCLQDKWKLYVTRPAGQVQYWNNFVPWQAKALSEYTLVRLENPNPWQDRMDTDRSGEIHISHIVRSIYLKN